MMSSDSISSSTSSFWSSSSTFCNNQNVQMLNKGVQAGKLLEFKPFFLLKYRYLLNMIRV